MSALNVYLRRDRAWMQTDASLYDQQGRIVRFGPKAFTMANLRAVVSARGLQGIAPTVAPILSWSFSTFDEMVTHGSIVVRDAYLNFVRTYVDGRVGERDIEMLVLGWSEKEDRPRAFRFYSESIGAMAGVEPYRFHPFEEDENWELSPAFQSLEPWQRLGRQGIELDENGFTTEQFDPVAHGLAYMEEQRQIRVDLGQNKQISIVGGFLLSHEITRDGVSERIVQRWPDKVGEPIQPEERPAFENVTPLNLNRKQRRAVGKRSIYA